MKKSSLRCRSVRPLQIERLESREVFSATVFEHDNIGYFVDAAAPQIERYDIATETWLAPIDLSGAIGTPTVAYVDDDGIYAAYGKAVYRYNLDGTGQTHLLNTQYDVRAIFTDENLLLLNHGGSKYVSINKATNTVIDTHDSFYAVTGLSIAPEANQLFSRTTGLSPSDIRSVAYDNSGNFIADRDSPYHGDFPGGSTTWTFPDGSKVVDNSGTIYATSNLTQLNSFGTRFNDIDFYGNDIPIVLNGNTLTAFSQGMLPTGSKTLSYAPNEIFVNDEHIITFRVDSSSPTGYVADLIPLTDLTPPTPGDPVNPVGLPYTPSKVELAADGTVLLLSKEHQSIFRWDPVTQQYADSIRLVGTPNFMTYSAPTNTLYVAYANGLIQKLDLNAPEPREVPLVTLPAAPTGLAMAGPYLFTSDGSGAWGTHSTFAADGTRIDSVDWNYHSPEYIWSEQNQKMYFFSHWSPMDLYSEEINANGVTYATEPAGGIGVKRDTPLHGDSAIAPPIRISPNGDTVLLGSGAMFDPATMGKKVYSLANSIKDAAWLGDELFTVRNVNGVAEFQRWAKPTYALDKVAQLSGTAQTLVAVASDRLLSITMDGTKIPTFTVLNRDLDVVHSPLALSADHIAENNPVGAIVGTLLGGGVGDISYELVAGEGDADNASFTIVGNALTANASFNFEAKNTYSLRVRSTGTDGITMERAFTIGVSNANDAPVLDTSPNAKLSSIMEDTTDNAGTPVSWLVYTRVSDEDAASVRGVAITGVTGTANGTWQYSLDNGAVWQDLGEVSPEAARLLPAGNITRIRFVPKADFSGQVQIQYRAWDRTQGTVGDRLDLSGGDATGGTSAFSSALETASLTVVPVNDAPTLDDQATPNLISINEDNRYSYGTPVWMLLKGMSDVDAGAKRGLAITAEAGSAHGIWQFTLDNGVTWKPLGTVSESAARLLPAHGNYSRIRFVPGHHFNGTVQLTFRAWDQTQETAGAVVDLSNPDRLGDRNAFSTMFATASLSVLPVNDAPLLNLGVSEVGYARNSPAILLAGAATVKDFDSQSFNGGWLRVNSVTGGYPEDRITIGGPFKVVGGEVIWNNTAVIGTLDANSGIGTEPLVIRFNANATRYRVEQLFRSLKFGTTGLPGDRSLTFSVHDGGDASNEASLTVHVA